MDKKNVLIAGVAALLATVATILVVRSMQDRDEEKPPRKAPQLPIQNPGEQSEFTTTASESDIG